MNIRSVSNPAVVLGKEKIEAANTIKSDEADDREANGQQPFSDGEAHRELTDEEIETVLEKIRSHEGIQKHGLIVKLSVENDQKIVKVEDPEGNVVKRFVERDLFFFLEQPDTKAIKLVDKSA